MIRFANPGADIDHMLKIFQKLYAQLSGFSKFDLNNMAEVMTSANMASSKGYVGEEALKKSYAIKDLSRNPLYNQAKMYAEVYRMFGWIVSVETALQFKFTLLGAHVALSGESTKILIENCLLGIHFPTEAIEVKFTNKGKPYVNILDYFTKLDNILYRDEIIIGPLNIQNDNDIQEKEKSIQEIKNLRNESDSKAKLALKMEQVALENKISINTMRNYTRIIISALKYTGWAKEKRVNIYGINTKFLELTDYGLNKKNYILAKKYITTADFQELDLSEKNSICKVGFLNFMRDSDFKVEEDLLKLKEEMNLVQSLFSTQNIFFNPYQELSNNNMVAIFPEGLLESDATITKSFSVEVAESQSTYEITSLKSRKSEKVKENRVKLRINTLLGQNDNSPFAVIEKLKEEILLMKQQQFYPLIKELFEIIFQIEARLPQPGVNNERFDVIIPHDNYSIPIEVKSPTEELMLSVKAVRQALENKIVLLSRESYKTERNISSLAVGFNVPNNRSDVHKLINEIKETYNLNIAILNIETLLKAAINCVINNKKYLIEDFREVYGVIDFEDL